MAYRSAIKGAADDLDVLNDLPDVIAMWVFKAFGLHLSLTEARQCARAALNPPDDHPSLPSPVRGAGDEDCETALRKLVAHFEGGEDHGEGAFDESCPDCVALEEARALLRRLDSPAYE